MNLLRPLGQTGLLVSPIALGGAPFGYVHKAADWDPYADAGRIAVSDLIESALDAGINYIDTAAYYGDGHSETLIGEVLRRRRGDCVLASKVWFELDYHGVCDSVAASLDRLQTDHIDILQIHGRFYRDADVRHIVEGGPLQALRELKICGIIGHIGITTEEPWTVLPFLEFPDFEVYQIAYNLIYQNAALHFLDRAHEAGVGVVTMRSLTSGMFQHQMQLLEPSLANSFDLNALALRFNLCDSRIQSAIIGMRWPDEVQKNLAVLQGLRADIDLASTPRTTVGIYRKEDAMLSRHQRMG